MTRKNTKEINIGGVVIGGGKKIAIQTMTNTKTSNIEETLLQINSVANLGCDICRIAIFDKLDAQAVKDIVDKSPIPLVADIHFNADFALTSIESGISKIRINPSNFPPKRLNQILDCAKMQGIPIRIGVNGGSPDKELLAKFNGDKVKVLSESIALMVADFEKQGFSNIVLSAKSSDVPETLRLNAELSNRFDYPLHIGLTEAGPLAIGITRNSIAISNLLLQGIGDTIRVSLTASPEDEVLAAKNILQSVGLPQNMIKFVSCPKCGRCQYDLEAVAKEIYEYVKNIPLPLTIAVMGCEVNGPGECAEADLGMAGGATVTFFKKGQIYKRVNKEDAVALFKKEIGNLISNDK